jgi:hypothetical protein
MLAGFNLQVAAQFLGSFPHAGDANADRFGSRRVIQHSIRYAVTVVVHLYQDSVECLSNPDRSPLGLGMEVHVCEARLYDSENGEFSVLRQPAQVLTYFDVHMQAIALVDSVHVPMNCDVQPAFVKQRRV